MIIPAFTCVAVPNAVLYAGARPVWADIDPTTYCLDPTAAAGAVTSRTRAILAQNTYGLSADLAAIMGVAGRHAITVVDDCTHGLGGTYRGKPNGATAPLSFFSTQWSKPISTGLGGFAVDPDGTRAERLRALEAAASEPSRIRVGTIQTLVRAHRVAGGGRLFRGGRAAYRALSRLDFVPASSSNDELAGAGMPPNFLTSLSEEQARIGSGELRRLPRRSRTGATSRTGIPICSSRMAVPLRRNRPIVNTRSCATRSVSQIGRIHGGGTRRTDRRRRLVHVARPCRTDRLEQWGYLAGSAPIAERACRNRQPSH